MLDHSKPEFAKESEPLRILVVVVKRWRHLGNRLWACRIAVISLLHFRPNRLFSTLYTASQLLLRQECESGHVNNWEGLQINKKRSRYEIIWVKKNASFKIYTQQWTAVSPLLGPRTHQHGKASTVSTPVRCVILHFRDRRGAALFRYRNRPKTIVLMCEQNTVKFRK